MKTLQIVESAYRATVEEQDDTILWMTHAMRGAGAELGVLLCGNAVSYAVRGQEASGIQFGEWQQTQPPNIAGDLAALVAKGVEVYVVEDDLKRRGIAATRLIESVKPVARKNLAGLFDQYARLWHW